MSERLLIISVLLFLTLSHSQSTDKKPLRNLAFLGSTGNGKSATCNFLIGKGPDTPFKVGHRATGETMQVVEFTVKSKGIRVIDTPGFGDNRFDEARISNVIKQFIIAIVDPFDLSNPKIDAFLLVVKLTPRASTLKSDLNQAIEIFGSSVLKSMVMIVIDPNYPENGYEAEDFLNDLKEMPEVVNLFKEYKNEEPNHNWFVMWDNKNPRPEQEQELYEKIEKLEAYTNQKFIEAEKESKQRFAALIKEGVEKRIQELQQPNNWDKAKFIGVTVGVAVGAAAYTYMNCPEVIALAGNLLRQSLAGNLLPQALGGNLLLKNPFDFVIQEAPSKRPFNHHVDC